MGERNERAVVSEWSGGAMVERNGDSGYGDGVSSSTTPTPGTGDRYVPSRSYRSFQCPVTTVHFHSLPVPTHYQLKTNLNIGYTIDPELRLGE